LSLLSTLSRQSNDQRDQRDQGESPLRIGFLGSGRLAVPVLTALAESTAIALIQVISQPDKPGGRQRQLLPTPLAAAAAQLGLATAKPVSANADDVVAALAALALDLLVVVDYGQLIKPRLLELPRYGCLNVHASLLPRYRGAAPINAAIRHGDVQSGITFMRMDKGLDTGGIYESHPVKLTGQETALTLEQQLADLAAARIVGCIKRICRENLQAQEQAETGATYAPKLTKHDGEIDWRRCATDLERQIRAFIPWPGSYFWLPTGKQPMRVHVLAARVGDTAADCAPATVVQADKQAWRIACGDATVLELLEVVPEGKRQMSASAFLRGHAVPVNTRLQR